MEFIKSNFLNTTTMIAVNSNTATAGNIFSSDEFFQYYSDGFDNDSTTTTITITFGATTAVSRIALLGTNAKQFRIFYNGATASTFSLSSADTSASAYTNNADSNKYFKFSTISVSSITLDIYTTQTANQEKIVGQLICSDSILEMPLLPNATGYKPSLTPKQIVHKLSDGGTRIHNVRKKWDLDIKLKYVSETFRDDLYDIWKSQDPFVFQVFGTSTSWKPVIFEAVWPGDFEFYEYSDDAISSGYSGTIKLRETPS